LSAEVFIDLFFEETIHLASEEKGQNRKENKQEGDNPPTPQEKPAHDSKIRWGRQLKPAPSWAIYQSFLLESDALEVVPISLRKSEKVESGGEVLTGNAIGRAGGESRFSFIDALTAQVFYPPMGWPIRRPNYIYSLLRRHRIHPQPSPAAPKASG
jgi:hypothetical protein